MSDSRTTDEIEPLVPIMPKNPVRVDNVVHRAPTELTFQQDDAPLVPDLSSLWE